MTSTFWIVFAGCILIILCLIFLANCIQVFFSKFNLGFLVMCLWSGLVCFFFFIDYFEIPPVIGLLVLAVAVVLLVAYLLVWRKTEFLEIFALTSVKKNILIFGCWVVALAILLLPLVWTMPDETVISGHFISNDSVMHALMSEGYKVTREIQILQFYNNSYPRAFLSFNHFFSEITNIEPVYLVLPMVLFSLSLLVFPVYDIWVQSGAKSKVNLILLSLIPTSGFLVTYAAYMLFATQVAVIPVLIVTMLYINRFSLESEGKFGVLCMALLVVSVFSIYGIFALFVALLALGWRVGVSLWANRGGYSQLISRVWSLVDRSTILVSVIVAILSLPALILTKEMIVTQFTGGGGLLTSWGNLPGGFLSVFHLSGLWPVEVEARDNLFGGSTLYSYVLLLLIIVHAWFVFRGKLNSWLMATFIQLCLPVFVFLFVFGNPYLHYKFLSFFIPFLLICSGVGAINIMGERKRIAQLLIALFVVASAAINSQYYKRVPVVQGFQLSELKYLAEEYMHAHQTLMLTNEDWIQFYRRQADDFTPNTQYRVNSYKDGDIDYLIWDAGYEKENKQFLQEHPDIKAKKESLPDSCVTQRFARFLVYDFNCK